MKVIRGINIFGWPPVNQLFSGHYEDFPKTIHTRVSKNIELNKKIVHWFVLEIKESDMV